MAFTVATKEKNSMKLGMDYVVNIKALSFFFSSRPIMIVLIHILSLKYPGRNKTKCMHTNKMLRNEMCLEITYRSDRCSIFDCSLHQPGTV